MAPSISQNIFRNVGCTVQSMFDPNASTESKIQSGINGLTSVFFALGDNAEAEAKAAVKENEEINNNLDSSLQTQSEANKNAIQSIIDQINENQKKITEILEQINGLEEEKEKINQEVELHQEEIQKQKEAYENATTPEERRTALDAISKENTAVQELLGRVQTLSNQQTELNEQTEEAESVNADLQAQADETKADGERKIEAINQQAVANKAQVTGKLAAQEAKYVAKAAEYMAKAVAAKSSSFLSSAFTFGLGGVAGNMAAEKYMQLSLNNTAAAGIIGSGVPQILSTIGNVFDGTNTNLGFLTNTASYIGSLTSAANGDVEAFFGISNSLGSQLGDSLQSWTETSENIDNAIEAGNQEETNVTGNDNNDSSESDVTADNNNNEEKKKFNAEPDFNVQTA